MTQANSNNSVDDMMQQGREIVKKANQRHVIIRHADGSQLADVNMTVVVLVALAVLFLQPIGMIAAIGGVAYGIYNKLKIEVVHELSEEDDTVEVNIPQE